MSDTLVKIIQSWKCQDGVFKTDDILRWIKQCNENIKALIEPQNLEEDKFWFYDKESGSITNKDKSFFYITGIKEQDIVQPIIVQNEIGFLGIISKEIDGVLHFLMQAKIEPGNINKAQISPTVQATKSNFTQRHRGKKTDYLDYFLNSSKYEVVVDQIQTEQSVKFYKKRNRNIIIRINEDIEVLNSFRWMTLGQIKALLGYDNLINMDTRTVISCIPFSSLNSNRAESIKNIFADKSLYNSLYNEDENNSFVEIYNYLNDYKMLADSSPSFIALDKMSGWTMNNYGILRDKPYSFKVSYFNISIEGREVFKWSQPLLESNYEEVNALFLRERNGILQFLVQAKSEIGAFDKIEIAPSVQCLVEQMQSDGFAGALLYEKWKEGKGKILASVLLSEEGGRFYHTQNHNIIILIDDKEIAVLPKNFFWIDYKTLICLLLNNNCVNEQLRTLLSLIRI
ncbi:MAG: NDP-hexose 2,3-dehydratase family protein [Elusimicrobiota bacterium]|jgi:oxidase EvaA|nr:NDP-hexose 2,3-dehydratase family protein [Elusimicrobiota bacterium]